MAGPVKGQAQRRFPKGAGEGMEAGRVALLEMLHAGGVNQNQLAVLLGVRAPRVSRLLELDANPTVATLGAVAEACGCRVTIGVVPHRRRR